MYVGELAEQGRTARGQLDVGAPAIIDGTFAADQPGGLEPIEQLDHGVMTQHHLVGENLHARLGVLGQAAKREQQLVLARLDPDGTSRGFGECGETAQLMAEPS